MKRPGKRADRGGSRASAAWLRRPFDSAILARARELAGQYSVRFSPCPEGGFEGECLELPYAAGHGDTIAACDKELREVVATMLASMLEDGQKIPAPLTEGRREQQVNVRLTAAEKVRLEEATRRDGYRSLSDYIRASALRRAS